MNNDNFSISKPTYSEIDRKPAPRRIVVEVTITFEFGCTIQAYDLADSMQPITQLAEALDRESKRRAMRIHIGSMSPTEVKIFAARMWEQGKHEPLPIDSVEALQLFSVDEIAQVVRGHLWNFIAEIERQRQERTDRRYADALFGQLEEQAARRAFRVTRYHARLAGLDGELAQEYREQAHRFVGRGMVEQLREKGNISSRALDLFEQGWREFIRTSADKLLVEGSSAASGFSDKLVNGVGEET